MARKTWIAVEIAGARDDKKAALVDYERAERELREKTARLQALRLAKEADSLEDAATAPDSPPKAVASKAKAPKRKSPASVWKT